MIKHLRNILFVVITVGATSSISLIGGIGIEAVQNKLLPLVPLVIALPALNTMVGDYAAIIAAHAGSPAERRRSKRALINAIAKVVWINIVGIVVLSLFIAWRRHYLLTSGFLFKFTFFSVASSVLIIGLMFIFTLLLDKLLERKKLNPDDVLIPVVTTVTDVLMLGLIALAAVFLF